LGGTEDGAINRLIAVRIAVIALCALASTGCARDVRPPAASKTASSAVPASSETSVTTGRTGVVVVTRTGTKPVLELRAVYARHEGDLVAAVTVKNVDSAPASLEGTPVLLLTTTSGAGLSSQDGFRSIQAHPERSAQPIAIKPGATFSTSYRTRLRPDIESAILFWSSGAEGWPVMIRDIPTVD
jgi:hypothetical protein